MLAFVLLRYDFKAKDGKRPANLEFQGRCIPNPTAEILFTRRKRYVNKSEHQCALSG